MTAIEISYSDYMEKVNDSKINDHSIDKVCDKHGQTGWSVSGRDDDDQEFVAILPFRGTASEVKAQLRTEVGLDDQIDVIA